MPYPAYKTPSESLSLAMVNGPVRVDAPSDRPYPPKFGTEEYALWSALHSKQGAVARWDTWRETGLTDADLLEAIAAEFGHSGGSAGPHEIAFSFRGGRRPAVWLGSLSLKGRPTLRGRTLAKRAREILDIPYPNRPMQTKLF